MSAEGTPVIAAADGTIEKLFNSVRGGITIYERSADQKLDLLLRAPVGLRARPQEGQAVKRGQVIGRVGHTGDASPDGPHLHFAVNRWRQASAGGTGPPINPYPLLAGK